MYRVMIVDDAEFMRRDIKRSKLWGDASGFVITEEANDGVEALEKISTNPVDLIITDIKMPNMDGLELLEEISKKRLCPYVVLLSEYTEFGYAREGIVNGAFDYIGKPMKDNELERLLSRVKKNIVEKSSDGQSADDQSAAPPRPFVKCFGRFAFHLGNQEIKFSTQKARDIFVYIICNQHRQITREELINVFFNTGDDKKDANNLRVTVFRIRQTLLQACISKDHVLIKDDFSVKTAPGICDVTDFLNFIDKNKVIEKSNIAEANKISDLITGEVLSDIDALWVTDLREYIMVEAENLMIKMAMYYDYITYKPLKAEYILIKLIEMNPLSENGHLALLDLCIRTNNRGKYIYYYRRYRETIRKDLDCEPEEKYREYYEKFSG